ncbi:MAG: phosphoribosylglycinamide formyltransferase [Thermodesulfobacteriota bacterium]
MSKKNIAVFVSGSGSNLQAIIDAEIECVKIKVVVSNNPDAYAVERAINNGIPIEIINHKDFISRKDFEIEIISRLEKYSIDLIVLAGFMRVLSSYIVNYYKHRIINIHPAILPSFPGIHSARQALEYGVKITGCTVHFVDDGIDTGPIILQSIVEIQDDDTEGTLLEKIHRLEHKAYPEAVKLFCEDRLKINGRKVSIIQKHK